MSSSFYHGADSPASRYRREAYEVINAFFSDGAVGGEHLGPEEST
jgi:hypothetical protein